MVKSDQMTDFFLSIVSKYLLHELSNIISDFINRVYSIKLQNIYSHNLWMLASVYCTQCSRRFAMNLIWFRFLNVLFHLWNFKWTQHHRRNRIASKNHVNSVFCCIHSCYLCSVRQCLHYKCLSWLLYEKYQFKLRSSRK